MQQYKPLLVSVFTSVLTSLLFLVGVGIMLMLFVVALFLGLLTKCNTRQAWRQYWSRHGKTQQTSFNHSNENDKTSSRQPRVIDGEYVVKFH